MILFPILEEDDNNNRLVQGIGGLVTIVRHQQQQQQPNKENQLENNRKQHKINDNDTYFRQIVHASASTSVLLNPEGVILACSPSLAQQWNIQSSQQQPQQPSPTYKESSSSLQGQNLWTLLLLQPPPPPPDNQNDRDNKQQTQAAEETDADSTQTTTTTTTTTSSSDCESSSSAGANASSCNHKNRNSKKLQDTVQQVFRHGQEIQYKQHVGNDQWTKYRVTAVNQKETTMDDEKNDDATAVLIESWDVTEQTHAEHYRGIFHHLPIGYSLCQAVQNDDGKDDYIFLEINQQFEAGVEGGDHGGQCRHASHTRH